MADQDPRSQAFVPTYKSMLLLAYIFIHCDVSYLIMQLLHCIVSLQLPRHLERRLPVSGLERGQACHPSLRSGSGKTAAQILRCAQDDMPSLQMSNNSDSCYK